MLVGYVNHLLPAVRALYITYLFILFAYEQMVAQDVFTTQTWELSLDNQLDGWVDSGDRVLISTQISSYDSLSHNLTFHNSKRSPHLSLVPNTTKTSHGVIVTTDDATVDIHAISITKVGEKVDISSEYEVTFSPDQADNISIENQGSVRYGDQEVLTNIIDIAVKGQKTSYGQGSLLKGNYVLLGGLAIFILMIVIFLLYKSKNTAGRLTPDL